MPNNSCMKALIWLEDSVKHSQKNLNEPGEQQLIVNWLIIWSNTIWLMDELLKPLLKKCPTFAGYSFLNLSFYCFHLLFMIENKAVRHQMKR